MGKAHARPGGGEGEARAKATAEVKAKAEAKAARAAAYRAGKKAEQPATKATGPKAT